MIVDYIRNLEAYPQFAPYRELILDFIRDAAEKQLPDGKYPLVGPDRLFALVQSCETKPYADGKMESHVKYADLQYIAKGEEYIYYDPTDRLVPEETPAEGDIIFYRKGENHGGNLLREGMFGYYAPGEGHMPCIRPENGNNEKVRKIVFKIRQ